MPTPLNQYELYQQVLKLEFKRELHALVEAANGRREFKADFTDKILGLVGKLIEPAVDAANIALPAVSNLLKSGAEYLIESKNEARKAQKTQYFLLKGFDYNPNALNVLAEQMSITALKRYQWFVSQLDQNSVILFAKAGVERMLEYLARMQLPLSIEHLLDGLLKGHSGAYVSGYFNTQLTPIDYLAKRIPSSRKIQGAFGFTSVTAEGMYGRSGLMSCDHESSSLHVHALFNKNKAKHKIIVDKQEHSRFEKIKDSLSKEGRERWFDYGYTKAHAEYKEEPKYGYALVSPAEVNSYYGAEQNITTKRIADLESPLKASLATFAYEIIPFNKPHLNSYLLAKKELPQLTLLAYLKELFNAKNARLGYFDANDKDLSHLDLSGAHLDGCVFDYCIFPADLSNTTLRNSFLRYADFRGVKQAKGLDLLGAHAEYLEASDADLSHANLRSSNLLGANLAKANLTNAAILGANLVESNLQETICPSVNLQDIQIKQKQLTRQQLRLEEKQNAQSKEIAALRKTVGDLQTSNQTDIAEKLDQFLQESAARKALERYCHSEIEKLTIQAQQQEKLSQQHTEHLESIRKNSADLQKQQLASEENTKQMLSELKHLNTDVNAQSSQLNQLSQALDELTTNTKIQLDEYEQRLQNYYSEITEKITTHTQQQTKLSQEQQEHLQKLQEDLTAFKKLQTVSQKDNENLLDHYQKLTIRVDKQDSQLKEIKQFLENLMNDTQHRLKQLEQQIGHLSDKVKEIKDEIERGKPKPTPSLSVERLQQIKQELCARYQKNAVMLEFAPYQSKQITVPINEKTFIHLALVAQAQQQEKERSIREELKQNPGPEENDAHEYNAQKTPNNRSEDMQRQQLLNSWEMLNQVQEPININELWLSHKNDPCIPEHMQIEGSAGTGKTTLCGYIATQWSEQKLWTEKFTWVLWIPLRNLIDLGRYPQHHHPKYSVKLLVMGECFGCLPNEHKPPLTLDEQENVWQQLQLEDQAGRILYVLDGYDEIAGYEIRPELNHLQTAISQLMQSKHILLTTRPQVINTQLLKEQARRLVTTGLSDENIPPYVEHYFNSVSNQHKAKQHNAVEEKHYDPLPLVEILIANQTLWTMSHVPLHLSLICLAYAEKRIQVPDLRKGFSLTQLYQEIVSALLLRYAKEKSKGIQAVAARLTAATVESEPNTRKVTKFLEEFAFRGMSEYDLILDDKLLNETLKAIDKDLEFVQDLIASGLLKEITDQGKIAYQFMHLTFQEFFAARYLARKFNPDEKSVNEWKEYFHEYKHKPRFAVMLWFTAGLLKDKQLQEFFQLLQAPPKDEVGLYHLCLVMRCLAEAGYPEKLTLQVSQYLGKSVEKCWVAIREGIVSKDRHKEIKTQSAQAVLQALVQQRLLTPKIEFIALSLNTIVKDLSDKNWEIRQAAARALGKLKVPTPEILQGLVALLKDNDSYVREAASEALALALVELKTPTPEILQGLVALLKDNESYVKQVVARALGELKASSPEILLALVALLKDNESYVRQAAAGALGKLKAPTPEILQGLVALLKDNGSDVRQAAARALGELKAPTPEILLALVALLKDKKWQAREGAARALGKLKAPTPEILLALVALLKDDSEAVRYFAALALGELKAPTAEILLALVALLKDEKWQAREGAAHALGELKAPTPEILQGLVALLKDNNRDVRRVAALALGKLKAPTPEILQGLVALLKDDIFWVRQAAALALGELKAPTPEILQGLVALLNDDSEFVRLAAAQALARVLGELKAPTPEILQGLVALLKENQWRVREAVARALGELKTPTPEILLALVALLKDKEWDVGYAAAETLARALRQLKAPTPEILLALVALLKDNESFVRYYAAFALGKLKAPTPEILQGLGALLTDKEWDFRQAASEALNQLSTDSLFNIYFQQNGQADQSSLQQKLLFIISQRWLINRQAVKFFNQEIHWLEQGQWQHLPIPANHPHFQSSLTKTIEKFIGPPLTLTFSKLSVTNTVSFFPASPFSSQPASTAEHKEPQPKKNKGFIHNLIRLLNPS